MSKSFYEPSACNFKPIAKRLYDSGNGLILCQTKISDRSYLTIFHKLSGFIVFDLTQKPTKPIKACLPVLNEFFSQFTFDIETDQLKNECIVSGKYQEVSDKAFKIKAKLYK